RFCGLLFPRAARDARRSDGRAALRVAAAFAKAPASLAEAARRRVANSLRAVERRCTKRAVQDHLMSTKVNMMRFFLMAAAGLAVALAQPVSAHHSFAAEFDANKTITLTGTVTKLEWMNPHIWVYLDVKDDKGDVQRWQ